MAVCILSAVRAVTARCKLPFALRPPLLFPLPIYAPIPTPRSSRLPQPGPAFPTSEVVRESI